MLRMLIAATIIVTGHRCIARAAEIDFASAAVSQELTDLWTGFCLDRFPADLAVNVYATSQGAKPMSLEEVKRFLPENPGRGWYLHTKLALYAITIEKSPAVTCAVRRMTPDGVPSVKPLLNAAKAYAEKHHGKLENGPAGQAKTPDGVGDISAVSTRMTDATGKAQDSFWVVLTNYHGHAPEFWKPDAMGGVGVEVRLVRELMKP